MSTEDARIINRAGSCNVVIAEEYDDQEFDKFFSSSCRVSQHLGLSVGERPTAHSPYLARVKLSDDEGPHAGNGLDDRADVAWRIYT